MLHQTFIHKLCSSQVISFRAVRAALILMVIGMCFKTAHSALGSLAPDLIYRKDLLQDFLMIHALDLGKSPYLNISELKTMLLPQVSTEIFGHPSPHPPQVVLFLLPFRWMSYETFATAWLVSEVIFVMFAAQLAARLLLESKSKRDTLLVAAVFFAASPVRHSFIVGTFSSLLLFLSALIMFAWIRNRDVLLGLTLGMACSIKFFGLTIGLFLLWMRRLTPLWIASTIYFVSLVGAIYLLTPTVVMDYLQHVIPAVEKLYRSDSNNQSLWSLGQRLFVGLYPPGAFLLTIPPLISFPAAEPFFRIVFLPIVVFLTILRIAQCKDLRVQAVSFISLATLVTPLLWAHGLSTFLLLSVLVFQYLRKLSFPTLQSLVGFFSFVLFMAGGDFASNIIGDRSHVSFAMSLMVCFPAFGASLLLLLLFHLERKA